MVTGEINVQKTVSTYWLVGWLVAAAGTEIKRERERRERERH
jgi:hypothetical protein